MTVYVYAIKMNYDEVSSQDPDRNHMWDRKSVLFGIITNEKLPEVRIKRKTLVIRLPTFKFTWYGTA
jgi:hypothetical protein